MSMVVLCDFCARHMGSARIFAVKRISDMKTCNNDSIKINACTKINEAEVSSFSPQLLFSSL